MDFNLKQWRFHEDDDDDDVPAKLPRLFFDSSQIKQEEEQLDIIINNNTNSNKTDYSVSPQLHLFVPTDGEDNNNNNTTNNNNSNEQQRHPSDQSTTRLPKMGGGGSYFSYGQWQELELQALIYRHMLAGAAIPPQLLQMVHKSLFNGVSLPASNSLTSPYFVHPLQHYSQYHPALMQSGYWGRGAMDPEPGRCRRTDGKKWRCSKEVVGGQKYCERHVHRGRNRSRKPVELHPDTTTNLVGGTTSNAASAQAQAGRTTHYDLSGTSSSLDGFHHAQRHTGSQAENNFTSETENMNGELKYGGQPLRRFFDDWTNRSSDSSASSTSLSISTPGNVSSDFSLKLATGNGGESVERETLQSGWGGAGWTQANRVVPIGGPLAEALRGSEVSHTSVLNLVK